jgi:glycosyltransferase involved in cell wall biosynthesis
VSPEAGTTVSTSQGSSLNPLLILVAPVVPDSAEYRTPAFSRAGNMFVTNLVAAFAQSHRGPDRIVSFLPIPVFPRSRRIWIRGEDVTIAGVPTYLVGFVNLPVLKYVVIGLALLTRILRAVNHTRSRSAIIYCYNAVVPVGPAALLAARLTRSSAVVSVNDVWKPGELVPNTAAWRFDYWCQRRLIPRFDAAVAVTDKVMRELAPSLPYVRIDGGIADGVFDRTGTARAESKNDFFTVVASGSLDEANGIVELIDAFRLIANPQFRLIVAGGGPLERLVRDAAASDSRITYTGLLPFDEVLKLYTTADLLANLRITQRMDSGYFFPSKLMEYLASGTPVLSTCTGHLEAEYGDFVFLVREESPAAIAKAIQQAADAGSDLRREMGARARSYMLNNKTWKMQAQRIMAFLDARLSSK